MRTLYDPRENLTRLEYDVARRLVDMQWQNPQPTNEVSKDGPSSSDPFRRSPLMSPTLFKKRKIYDDL